MTETILTNARLVLESEVFSGTIVFKDGVIADVSPGFSRVRYAIDAEGDYVAPGLVEMHTDNPEKHFMPRPNVFWPNKLAAALAHDAQMAAAGVTTVYDSITAGTITGEKDYRRKIFSEILEAISQGMAQGVFRIDHRIHIRCELTADGLLAELEPHVNDPLVQLISLMDHTPGVRQYRNPKLLQDYYVTSGELSEAEAEREIGERMAYGPKNLQKNWPAVLAMFKPRGTPVATHDDTTEDDIALAIQSGAVISEFPTTGEAAAAAKAAGLGTVAGAPNVVRGGSHSNNVAVADLARAGTLDGLSSDYVPASLLQAVLTLQRDHAIALPEGIAMVTWKIADMVGLADRGRLRPGQRADLVRFRDAGGTPVVRGLWCAGDRVL
jgi:alpha-D-ribose 1-methylphosphonate 5-triphosphate diphosphatase